MSKASKDLIDLIQRGPKSKTSAYDTTATVRRIENDTAWVHIAGGVDETPVRMTINASEGDNVQVRVSGGDAFLIGNGTAPPTDDTTANIANVKATDSYNNSVMALSEVETAKTAAEQAEAEAVRASVASASAQSSADAAQASANIAQASADSASQGATETQNYARMAMSQLSIVENVVGVLELVSQNGEYELTEDAEVMLDKWYFTRSGTSPNYVYSIVNNPTGNPSTQGWYEIVNIDKAIQNYVSSHLVLDERGLWLQHSGGSTKLLLSPNNGLTFFNGNNEQIAQYGSEAIIGAPTGFNIRIGGTNNEIGFYQGSNKVAYINGQELYVENSLSFGNFVFYQRPNGHFTLKLV